MGLSFTNEDFEQMSKVQRAIIGTVQPYRSNTEAGLVVFALLRVARVLLRLYPKATRETLIRLACDYLQGHTEPSDVRDHEAPDGAARLLLH